MTDRKERAKERAFTEEDLRTAYNDVQQTAKMAPNIPTVIAKHGLEIRIDYGKWRKRDTVATYRVRLYDGKGGFRARAATAYGMNLSGILVEAYAQYLADKRREKEITS